MPKKIILFELNEVPFKIVDHFVQSHPDSAFATLLSRGQQYRALSEDVGALSPWKTWPSLHRGVADEKHLIGDFGQPLDEVDRAYPPVWRLLQGSAVRIGLFGSLHSYPVPADTSSYAFYVPDIFASGPECFPESLSGFQHLCLSMARDSVRNVSTRVPVSAALGVLANAPALGLRARTFGRVAQQLLDERMQPWKSARRRTFQPLIAFDVFMRQLKTQRPDFVTFFTNHVASSMHRYWAASFPDEYETMPYDAQWLGTYRGEIDYAMRAADRMLSELIAFVDSDPSYSLVVASSMGQQAVAGNPRELQVYVQDAAKFFSRLGIEPGQWEPRPAMFAQYNVRVQPSHVGTLAMQLARIQIAGEPLEFRTGPDGFFSLDFGQENLPDAQVRFDGVDESLERWGLYNVEIADKSGCTAYHIHEGILLTLTGAAPDASRTEVSALDVTPALLQHFGVTPPAYMRRPALALT